MLCIHTPDSYRLYISDYQALVDMYLIRLLKKGVFLGCFFLVKTR